MNDAPEPWQMGFQDSAAPGFEGMIDLHDSIFFYLVVISIGVFWVLFSVIINFSQKNSPMVYKYSNHGTLMELIWTMTPALVLMAMAFPSFSLLYMLDEVVTPIMTIKVVGHQWYWSYEYADFITENEEAMEFDSYMVPDSDLELGQLRLLEVDNKMVVPANAHISIVVTSTDVIHDFAVPSLGLKIDAVPGSLNQSSFMALSPGVFSGQCSEMCGVYHGFMPMAVKALPHDEFLFWLESMS